MKKIRPLAGSEKIVATDKGIIKLRVDRIYGMIKMYPDNDTARLFCKFAKVKSLTAFGVKCLMELGYSIETDKPGFDPLKVKGIVRKAYPKQPVDKG